MISKRLDKLDHENASPEITILASLIKDPDRTQSISEIKPDMTKLSPFLTVQSALMPLLSAIACVGVFTTAHQTAEAQVQGVCFVENETGQVFDLSALCGESDSESGLLPRPTLSTGDIQVTLDWSGFDDLDLAVVDPAGDTIGYFNPRVASGGALDVDANAFCFDIMSDPVENIFWPDGEAPPGEYTVIVNLYALCDGVEQPANPNASRAVDFSLRVLVQGEIREFSGAVSPTQPDAQYSFSSP